MKYYATGRCTKTTRSFSTKSAAFAIVFCLMASLTLAGCSGGYKINIVSGEDFLEDCPSHAKEGETVVVKTFCVTDADLYVSVNGDRDFGDFTGEGHYEFIMPAEDVNVKIVVITNGLA